MQKNVAMMKELGFLKIDIDVKKHSDLSLSLLKMSTGLREAGDFHEPAVPSQSW
jgi:hypothetical protein